ncbi:4-oxalomesaconate tautomerase [Limibaculum sp. M0105]|uniref:4-oxalomesaconate tautomerase n=1 Tax=Thermohalobaculum xanthum TaxID=2753746 RepID=A0A8J7M800_9RHOB|nr:4-oxalomesaconate tautomerase [Thermohalobaculum xanthum]MBK0399577.1 4-oxalomesaconate tautomerase [Thermohalobaculum xanthum]
MKQTAIPFHFLRGGTSRGPYFRREDLPQDRESLAQVLIAAMGSGHPLNIDGVGGGAAVTTKVAMLSRSERDDADIDYFFAQVSVEDRQVDFKPTCGNILSGVGPAAIEMGLIAPQGDTTRVRIHAVNTGAMVEAVVQTPGGTVTYDGDAQIDGVPGMAAPVLLNFMDVVGSSTGAFLPTGSLRDVIDGIEVTCMDVAMPVVIARADAFGLSGYESAADLDANRDFYARMEAIRQEAGKLMGMGDVSNSVTPKFALLASPRDGGTIAARYFMPRNCHPTMAVTGAQCIASCALTPGTVADGLAERPGEGPAVVEIEHPSGKIDVTVDFELSDGGFRLRSAGLLRTARLLARGEIFVPHAIWAGPA